MAGSYRASIVYDLRCSWMLTLPFAINLMANLLFMPHLAGLRNLPLASLDIVIVWGTLL